MNGLEWLDSSRRDEAKLARRSVLLLSAATVLVVSLLAGLVPLRAAQGDGLVGGGNAASCTAAELASELTPGSQIFFNCGADPVTLVVPELVIPPGAPISIDGGGKVTLSGGNANRLFSVPGGATLTLSRIALVNGSASGFGGALFAAGSLTLEEVSVRDSHALATADPGSGVGGAIHVAPGARLVVRGGSLTGNRAAFAGGAIATDGRTVVSDATFENNQAVTGGAINSYGPLVIERSAFLANTTNAPGGPTGGPGGALAVIDGTATVTLSRFEENSAGEGGGALYVNPNYTADVTLRDSVLRNNVAVDPTNPDGTSIFGGGMLNGRVARIERVLFEGNRAGSGGGYFQYQPAAVGTLEGVALVGNLALGNGGGLLLSGGAVTVNNSTLSGNLAAAGGGLAVTANGAALRHVTFFGNSAPTGANLYLQDVTLAAGASLFGAPAGGGANCEYSSGAAELTSTGHNRASDASCTLDPGAGDVANVDLQLSPLASTGGLTPTHTPALGSPARDAVPAADCPPSDQRGYVRSAGAACDAGAVEADGQPPNFEAPPLCGGIFPVLADTTLDSSQPSTSLGAETTLTFARSGATARSLLLRFDLSALPPDTAVASAWLELPVTAASGPIQAPLVLTEVNSGWAETSVTANSVVRGYQYSPVLLSRAGVPVRVDLRLPAMRWVSGAQREQSVILEPGAGADFSLTVASREGGPQQPRLVVACAPEQMGTATDSAALDTAQQAARAALTQASTVASTFEFGYQGGVTRAFFSVAWPPATPPDGEARARWFLNTYRGLLRLSDPATQLQLVDRDENDASLVFRQLVNGVPVESAQLIVHLGPTSVAGLTGAYLPGLSWPGAPSLDAQQATQLALAAMGPGTETTGEARLRVVADSLLEGNNNLRSRLAWLVPVAGPSGSSHLYVDAHSGRLLAVYAQTSDAFDLNMRRLGGTPLANTCAARLSQGMAWYTEDGLLPNLPVVSNPGEADTAYSAIRSAYDYWLNTRGLGRDGIDGRGGQIVMFVNTQALGRATWWVGCNQVEVGTGSATQDVVAHEVGHGIMDFTVYPTYQRESGALNESLADIFGYATDSEDWTIAEDLAGEDPWRDMSLPQRFRDPDNYAAFVSTPAETACMRNNDNCGVHTNSGIHNKAAQLLIAGGSWNGRTVVGVGRDKAVALYYGVLRYRLISESAGFLAMRDALISLIGLTRLPGPAFLNPYRVGFTYTNQDICSIRNAYAAVGVGSGDADCDGVEDLQESQPWGDADRDGIRNSIDLCPSTPSLDNGDADGDTVGDICDPDADNDQICNSGGPRSAGSPGLGELGCRASTVVSPTGPRDNCPFTPNVFQEDLDNDGRGNACDEDKDNDGRADAVDNCPNHRQGLVPGDWNNMDGDAFGDICDLDSDNDGICNVGGPLEPGFGRGVGPSGCLRGSIGPGLSDVVDSCVLVPNPDQEDTSEAALGGAADAVGDACDLCPALSSFDNADTDGDKVGNPCDLDADNDHICDVGGPLPPGALGVFADPNWPASGCEPGRAILANPLRPGDNCRLTPNQDQRDDNKNNVGFACDPAERSAWFAFLPDYIRDFTFKVSLEPVRVPLPICTECPIISSLPPNYQQEITVQVPQGYSVQVVDTFGAVKATAPVISGASTLRFYPAPNALRLGGLISAADVNSTDAALAESAVTEYFLEFIPDPGLPLGAEVTAQMEIVEGVETKVWLPIGKR